MAKPAAKSKPIDNLNKARETLVVQQHKIVAQLAKKYSAKAAADFVAVTDSIELLEAMIRQEGKASQG